MRDILKHTFVICAYQESPFLEECIHSLMEQSVPSRLILSTSTPNSFIASMAEKYSIPLYINEGEKGIAYDWNFGYLQADTELITIAHQDDVYESHYTKNVLKNYEINKDAQLLFTDYYELRKGERVSRNKILVIKRILNYPLRFRLFSNSRFIRRRILSLGCSICCPSVTFVRINVPAPVFDTQYKNSCDYITWEILSRRKGGFSYIAQQLVGHRIYQESATTQNISDNSRSKEDREILARFWPKPLATILFLFYKSAQRSNTT